MSFSSRPWILMTTGSRTERIPGSYVSCWIRGRKRFRSVVSLRASTASVQKRKSGQDGRQRKIDAIRNSWLQHSKGSGNGGKCCSIFAGRKGIALDVPCQNGHSFHLLSSPSLGECPIWACRVPHGHRRWSITYAAEMIIQSTPREVETRLDKHVRLSPVWEKRRV